MYFVNEIYTSNKGWQSFLILHQKDIQTLNRDNHKSHDQYSSRVKQVVLVDLLKIKLTWTFIILSEFISWLLQATGSSYSYGIYGRNVNIGIDWRPVCVHAIWTRLVTRQIQRFTVNLQASILSREYYGGYLYVYSIVYWSAWWAVFTSLHGGILGVLSDVWSVCTI